MGPSENDEEICRLLLDRVRDYAIFMISPEGRVASWNSGAEFIKGYNASEIIGKPIEIFYTAEDIERNTPRHNLQMTMEKGHYEDEGWRVRKDGTKFWANVIFTALWNKHGQLRGYAKITRDITEKNKFLEQLAYMKTLIDQSDDAIISADQNGRIISWNHGAEKYHGYMAEYVIGITLWELQIFEPHLPTLRRVFSDTIKSGSSRTEMTILRKDGTSYFGAVNANAIRNAQNNISAVVLIIKDISTRKQLEEVLQQNNLELELKVKERTDKIYDNESRYRALIENNNDIISLMDRSFKIIYRSPSAARITGWSDEEILNTTNTENIHPEDQTTAKNIFAEVLANPQKPVHSIFRSLHKNGQYRWMEGVILNLLNDKHVKALVFNFRDVTERILSEEKIKITLKEIEDYKFALDASSIVAITDAKGIITRVNDNFCKISKYSSDELIGQDHRIISSGFHKKEFIMNLWKTIKKGEIWKGELKNKAKDGSYYWVATTIVPFIDNDHRPYQFVAIRTDISERKKIEEELQGKELRFRALIENSVEGISLADEYSNVLYRSPASAMILGVNPTYPMATPTHPDDTTAFHEKYAEALKFPGVPIAFQGRFRHAKGYYIWMEGTFTNMLDVEGVRAIVTNYRDITERKVVEEMIMESEKLYRNLFENLMHGFAYCKCQIEYNKLTDFTYQSVNNKYGEITGIPNITGKKASECMPFLLDPAKEYLAKISHVILSGTPERFESYFEKMDKWMAVSLYSPSKGYFIALLDDITIQKKAEQKIRMLNAELERKVHLRTDQLRRKSEEMEAFSYSVSHDLRAPLRGIIGFTSILEEEYVAKLDEEARRLMRVIRNNTEKMGNLIDDLLEFSRLGRNDFTTLTIHVEKMVYQVIAELETKSYEKKVTWSIGHLHDIIGDPSMIRQVWTNLISNALKYSGKSEHPEISISSCVKNEEIIFRISDNGVGFDMKYIHKLFKVFHRLHGTNEFEGTGVGLAIVEKIVSRHSGRIWAESSPDEGATFYFSMPLKHPNITESN